MRASPITRMSSVDPDQRVLSGLNCRKLLKMTDKQAADYSNSVYLGVN